MAYPHLQSADFFLIHLFIVAFSSRGKITMYLPESSCSGTLSQNSFQIISISLKRRGKSYYLTWHKDNSLLTSPIDTVFAMHILQLASSDADLQRMNVCICLHVSVC